VGRSRIDPDQRSAEFAEYRQPCPKEREERDGIELPRAWNVVHANIDDRDIRESAAAAGDF
jgi:hypothetical protein